MEGVVGGAAVGRVGVDGCGAVVACEAAFGVAKEGQRTMAWMSVC